jgi:hypothetical protein
MSRANGSVQQLRHDAMVGRNLRKRMPAIESRLSRMLSRLYVADPEMEHADSRAQEKEIDFIRNSLAKALRGGSTQ